MKLKRNTALILAGALALSAVPMNVFAYGTVSTDLDAYDNQAATKANTVTLSESSVTSAVKMASTTTVNGRTLLTPYAKVNSTVDNYNLNTEYVAPSPYIQIELDNNASTKLLDTDIVYKITLANGEFLNTTSGATATTTGERINGYLNYGTTEATTFNTYDATKKAQYNNFVMPEGLVFEYVNKNEAYIIVDSTNAKLKADLSATPSTTLKFNIPLLTKTTSESAPMTVAANGKGYGLTVGSMSATSATNVIGINNDAGVVTVATSTARNTIRPTFKFTEYAAGNFKPEGFISVNFNNGILPAATGTVSGFSGTVYTQAEILNYFELTGFGVDLTTIPTDGKLVVKEIPAVAPATTPTYVYEPIFLRRNDTELWVNMAAFGENPNNLTGGPNDSFNATTTGLHAETLSLEVQLNRQSKNYVAVSAKANWTDLISSTKVDVGGFSDYDYTFTTAKDTTVSGFKYPVFLGNRGFTVEGWNKYGTPANGQTIEGETNEDYKVLDLVISDTVDNAILWNNREFDIEFSKNVTIRGYEIIKAENFVSGYEPTATNFTYLDEEKLAESVDANSFKSATYTNVLSYDGLNFVQPNVDVADGKVPSITLRVYIDNATYKSGDITAKMTGNAISVDSDEVKVGEIVQSMDLTADVQALNQIAGPQQSGNITVTELVPGQINEDELYKLSLVAPGYLDSATSTWGFYDGDGMELTVDGVDEDDNLSEISVEVDGTTTGYTTASDFGAIEVDLEGLTESDSMDELRSFTVSDIDLVIGTLFTVPSFEFDVKLTSSLKNTPTAIHTGLYGVTSYEGDISDESVDKSITVDYLNAESTYAGGSYADYVSSYNNNYNDDISMTIGQESFTAVNAAGEAVTGSYTVEGNDPALYVPKLVGDDTYVSIRSFAQTIGGEVSWNQDTQTVLIYPQGYAAYVAGKGSRAAVSYKNPSVVEFKEPGKDLVNLEIKNYVGNSVSVLTIDDVNHLPLRFFAENIYKVKGIDTSDFATTKTFVIDAK